MAEHMGDLKADRGRILKEEIVKEMKEVSKEGGLSEARKERTDETG